MKKITLLMALIVSAFSLQMSAQNFQGATGVIPDATCPDLTPFGADVTGIGVIGDTHQIDEVVINITHTWVSDVEISLVAPDGVTGIQLVIAEGGSDDNFVNTVFSDEGNPPSIVGQSAPFTGVFMPEGGRLDDAFNGVDATGTWALVICDSAAGDEGTLTQWSIRFQDNPETCPAPFNITAENLTSSSFDLTWNTITNADQYQYVVVNAGDPIPDPVTTPPAVATDITTETSDTVFGLLAATDYDVYIRSICGGVEGPWTDVTTITTEDVCPPPTMLEIDLAATTDTSLTFSWATANNSTSTDWEVVLCGDAPFAGNDVAAGSSTGTSATATGLLEQTCYEVYVRNNCDADGFSTIVGPVTDSTLCTVKTAPYAEDFTGASVSGDPECWTQEGDYLWRYTSPAGGGTPAEDALDHTDGVGNEDFAWIDGSDYISDTPGASFLISPEVDVAGLTYPALRFSIHSLLEQAAIDAGDSFNSIVIQVNDGTGFSTVESVFNGTETSDPALPGWEDFIVDLTEEDLDGVLQVRFNISLTGSSPFQNDILVDDVSFDELGCQQPLDVDVDDIEFDNALVEFDGYSSAINGHFVAVVLPGVDPEVGPYVFNTDLAAGVEEINATGLEPLTCYEVYVRAICDGETSGFGPAVEFCTPGQCDEPDDLEASNITNMGADLTWDAVDGVLSYDYVVTVVGGDPNNAADIIAGTAGNTTDLMASVSLPDGTCFEAHVRSVCDPEGTSVWATSDVFCTEIGCNSDFFDTGGATGDYTDLEDYCVTIYPSENASAVTLTFTSIALEFGEDFLSVYNGEDDSQPFTLDLQAPAAFTSTDPSGAITVCFESDGAGVAAGWEANITCSILNDVCSTAIALVPEESFEVAAVEATSQGANTSTGGNDPSCGRFSGNGDGVWYTVEVPPTGSITIETQETVTGTVDIEDTGLAVYSGACGSLTEIACDDDNGVGSFSLVELTGLTPGDTLYIRVFGSDSAGLTGDFRIAAYDEFFGVEELNAAGFNMYPNPVNNELNLSANENIQTVEVFNLLGQSVAKKSPGALNTSVDMTNMNAGVYLVNVTINNQTGAYRVIKQ